MTVTDLGYIRLVNFLIKVERGEVDPGERCPFNSKTYGGSHTVDSMTCNELCGRYVYCEHMNKVIYPVLEYIVPCPCWYYGKEGAIKRLKEVLKREGYI